MSNNTSPVNAHSSTAVPCGTVKLDFVTRNPLQLNVYRCLVAGFHLGDDPQGADGFLF